MKHVFVYRYLCHGLELWYDGQQGVVLFLKKEYFFLYKKEQFFPSPKKRSSPLMGDRERERYFEVKQLKSCIYDDKACINNIKIYFILKG